MCANYTQIIKIMYVEIYYVNKIIMCKYLWFFDKIARTIYILTNMHLILINVIIYFLKRQIQILAAGL